MKALAGRLVAMGAAVVGFTLVVRWALTTLRPLAFPLVLLALVAVVGRGMYRRRQDRPAGW